ncbi:E3 ubiquitin-protein ligase rnf146-like [Symsagittifera roscoffensis]|uniref:E3 ubiquitin-protein ligase rnf146-like n=1 Tax=Symsagittifera roscoffensis TaxID=84072 RepID=UPI00307BE6AB
MASNEATEEEETRCPVCLELFVLPVKLPVCQHKFCFLCIKGVALRTGKCAMCRAQISETILTQPELLLENSATVSPLKKKVMDSLDENGNEKEVSEDSLTCSSAAVSNNNVRWFYSGYKGWWEYDERTSQELEKFLSQFNKLSSDSSLTKSTQKSKTSFAAMKKNEQESESQLAEGQFELMISGYVYVIDFNRMIQYRQNMTGRSRNIKRLTTEDQSIKPEEVKGISGIKTEIVSSFKKVVDAENEQSQQTSSSSSATGELSSRQSDTEMLSGTFRCTKL